MHILLYVYIVLTKHVFFIYFLSYHDNEYIVLA